MRDRPFEHPCIIYVLKKFLFESPRLLRGECHAQIFKPSLNNPNEYEVPIPALALVATAVSPSALLFENSYHYGDRFTRRLATG